MTPPSIWWLKAVLCAVLFSFVCCDTLPTCQSFNFHHEYTECDSDGGRWRVSVPEPGVCVGGAPNPPVRGRDCKFTCEAGQYLDVDNSQDCKKCSAGSYSLGGGTRFDTWGKLPDGFTAKSEEFSNEIGGEDESPKSNCSKSGWQPRGDVLAAFTGECTSLLTYSAKLVRAGSVTFTYQYDDENTIFHFYVHNDQCEAYHDPRSNVWPAITKDGEWKSHTMTLKSGLNIIYWKVIGMGLEGRRKMKPVLIKDIQINVSEWQPCECGEVGTPGKHSMTLTSETVNGGTFKFGVAFTSSCSVCPAGTFSGEGASICSPCPKDTFSDKAASVCKQCNADTEFAEPGSSKCSQRPSCTSGDFYSYNTPCDKSKHTQKVFTWKQPHICRIDLAGAAQLPKAQGNEPCPPCNPGMKMNATGQCEFCPKNFYSTQDGCTQCPVNTVPQYGLFYNWWNSLPPHMDYSCMSMEKNGCFGQHAWEPEGAYIRTGRGHDDDAYLMLTLKIPGFADASSSTYESPSKSDKPVYGNLEFVFETQCTKNCSFFFIEESENDGAKVLKSWDGTQKRQVFRYQVYGSGPVTYSWAYEKTSWEMGAMSVDKQRLHNDHATIHSINVTNTLIGGAGKCIPCPKGVGADGCIPCPAGAYIDDASGQCVQCPAHTAVRGRMSHGPDSCRPCGSGLVTKDHATCYSDCHYKTGDGKEYDFSALKGSWAVSGAKLFTTSGTQYYHLFNFTLCGSEVPDASCYNNFTSSSMEVHERVLTSFVCRSTIIPPKNPSVEPTLSAQPHALGDVLLNVTSNHDNVTRAHMEKLLTTAGWVVNEDHTDVHFTHVSERPTAACENGRYTVITMRCDVKERNNGTIELPPKCPDGTCDGCNFHILWKSRWACPACKEEDYDIVPGECVGGDQIVYYYPPKHCILSGMDDKPKSKHQKCPIVPIEVEIALLAILGVGVIMCGLLVYCWKRNKKLEYRYMKLIHSSGSREDGELPAAETCALDENEDDEHFDQVQFTQSKGKKLFNKIKSMTSKNDDPFESIKLTGGKHSL